MTRLPAAEFARNGSRPLSLLGPVDPMDACSKWLDGSRSMGTRV